MTETILKADFVRKIGCDPNDTNEMAILKFAEAEGLEQMTKFGFVHSPSSLGLNLAKSSHRQFLGELKKAHDVEACPSAAQAYDERISPMLQPSGIL